MPDCVIIPELAYQDVGEAVAWLCEKFGFEVRLLMGNHRAQLQFGQGAVIVTQRTAGNANEKPESLQALMVRVSGIERYHERAVGSGVKILRPIADYPYGERQYTVEDIGGHIWTFSQTIADVDPASWGGVLNQGTNAK